MTLTQLKVLRGQAYQAVPLPEVQWPPSAYYRFLSLLAKAMAAEVFVELGTCGGGASYNVAVMNPTTKVISIDLVKMPTVDEVINRCPNFEFVQSDSVAAAATIGAKYQGKINLLFVDTAHTYEQATAEFYAWLPYMAPHGIVCCDDLNRPGLDRFWAEVKQQKTDFGDLAILHIGGEVTDGGFGAILL